MRWRGRVATSGLDGRSELRQLPGGLTQELDVRTVASNTMPRRHVLALAVHRHPRAVTARFPLCS